MLASAALKGSSWRERRDRVMRSLCLALSGEFGWAASRRMISTSTSSPTFTTSLGWPMRTWDISETGIMPSTPPRSTKAPKSRTPVTLPLTILPSDSVLRVCVGQLLLLLLEQRAARQHHVAIPHLGDAEL